MATLVQTTPAPRHPPSAYPVVGPPSTSSGPPTQRPQPLYFVSSQPQMYMPQAQQPQYIAYDFTRQPHQAHHSPKHAQFQRRQNTIPQQPNSAPPHPRSQGMQSRSRSDEALREKSKTHSAVQSTLHLEAQSAPRPQSSVFRPVTLPPPPQIRGQVRPSSADGPRVESYRGRKFPDQRRYPSPRDSVGVHLPPPAVLGAHGLQPRYSAEDVTTLTNIGIVQSPFLHVQYQQQYPIQYSPRTTSLHAQHSPQHSPVSSQHSPQPQHMKPSQSPQPPHIKPPSPHVKQTSHVPQQIPPIQRRQSSLHPTSPRHDSQRPSRVLSPPPPSPLLKRASSVPELAPPQSLPLHRKSSSSSSSTSAASAPSQLETASTHSSVPSQTEQHSPFVPSPLANLVQVESPPTADVVSPQTTAATHKVPEKSRSLSARLRRALSFTGPTLHASMSTPDLHAAAAQETPVDDHIDTDAASISSTASSASVMLRKVSQGLKKSRKSIIGIFKATAGKKKEPHIAEEEDKFPFGDPEEDGATTGVCYATIEGEIARNSEERRKSMVFAERDEAVQPSAKKKNEPGNLRGILKNSDSRQSSFDSSQAGGSTDSISTPPQNFVPVPDLEKSLPSSLNHSLSTPQDQEIPENIDRKGDSSYFDITPASPLRQVVTAPATPTGTGRNTPRRAIQFSPRLEVHETWHSAEYDRRGEPATCNRLTAQLAQMIKEELNAYKMEEMVVHEESRSYTHFF